MLISLKSFGANRTRNATLIKTKEKINDKCRGLFISLTRCTALRHRIIEILCNKIAFRLGRSRRPYSSHCYEPNSFFFVLHLYIGYSVCGFFLSFLCLFLYLTTSLYFVSHIVCWMYDAFSQCVEQMVTSKHQSVCSSQRKIRVLYPCTVLASMRNVLFRRNKHAHRRARARTHHSCPLTSVSALHEWPERYSDAFRHWERTRYVKLFAVSSGERTQAINERQSVMHEHLQILLTILFYLFHDTPLVQIYPLQGPNSHVVNDKRCISR